MTSAACAMAAWLGLVAACASAAEPKVTVLSFDELQGWADDDHGAAMRVFLETCSDMAPPDWQALCGAAADQTDSRAFFELLFRPVLIEDGAPPLFTGYYEPEIKGSRYASARFSHPIYRLPPEAGGKDWLTRREIVEGNALAGRGLEIAWVEDPVDLFFLQIQGSGRIRLDEGGTLRVGYGGNNGHPYRSIGQELARRGILAAHRVSAQVIKNWVRLNPDEGKELLFHNPSYVFFRLITDLPGDRGPRGAMNRSVTAMRSLAVDPAYVPLGAPVWVEKAGATPFNRLMVAQDTGSAIKGAQRGDIFFGTGASAGRKAGRLKDPGRMVVLMPIQRAYAMLDEGAL